MEELILDCYERMSEASSRMLTAAGGGDWDALVAAESECSAQVLRLQAIGDTEKLSREAASRKMRIIRKVLAEDAEIRGLTQPWLATLEDLLCGQVSQRRLRERYA